MRLVLLTSVSCLWAGASALSFERAKSLSDENDKEGSLLRGRNLNTFLDPLDFDIEGLAGNGVEGGMARVLFGMCRCCCFTAPLTSQIESHP